MFKTKIILCLITIIYPQDFYAQDNCNHEAFITRFLQKITSKEYIPIYEDFNFFFDNHSEIEIGLREEYNAKHPNNPLSDNPNSTSLTLSLLLKNKFIIDLKTYSNCKNCNWMITNHYTKGTATIVYEIGSKCSKEMIKIQMINWKYKNRCGIVDILDKTNKSIFQY